MEQFVSVININLKHLNANFPPLKFNLWHDPLNISEQEAFHEKWLFGFEEQNPFLSTFEILNTFFFKENKKEVEIICQNKELFNVNQSISIYLSKITQLIDTEITPKHTKRNGEKWKEKYNKQMIPLESPKEIQEKERGYTLNSLKIRLKKLTQEMLRLQTTIANQNNYINNCAKIPSMIKEIHMNYHNQLLNLKNSPCQSLLRILDKDFGVQSIRRIELCNSFYNILMDHVIPNELKKIMEYAMKGQDFLNEQDPSFKTNPKKILQETQKKFIEETKCLEFYNNHQNYFSYMFDMAKNYEKVGQQSFTSEQLKQEALKDNNNTNMNNMHNSNFWC